MLRPFTIMWPFFVSLVFLYVTEKSFLHGHIITLKDSLPELYVLSLVLTVSDYADRAELSPEQKQEVAHYDNCTLYQDSIVASYLTNIVTRIW